MQTEYLSLLLMNDTWDIVNVPKGTNVIGCKWVFKTKRDARGNIIRFKARLVAKGYNQKEGIDYFETFSPVTRYSTLRVLFALAAYEGWELEQSDVTTAFLNAELDEEVYMEQPVPFQERFGEGVCRLRKGLYGLKQANRNWNLKINDWLLQFGFDRSQVDPCLYVYRDGVKVLILALYVDDMTYASNCIVLIGRFKKEIADSFKLTHEGDLHFILGMEVIRDRMVRMLQVKQERYIKDVLKRFDMMDCAISMTPAEPGLKLTTEMCPTEYADKEVMKSRPYRELVGSLLYLSVCTRPDITQAVSVLTRYVANPGEQHWIAAKKVLRYLKGTIDVGLSYGLEHETTRLFAYADSDWGMDLDTRRSTSGVLVMPEWQ